MGVNILALGHSAQNRKVGIRGNGWDDGRDHQKCPHPYPELPQTACWRGSVLTQNRTCLWAPRLWFALHLPQYVAVLRLTLPTYCAFLQPSALVWDASFPLLAHLENPILPARFSSRSSLLKSFSLHAHPLDIPKEPLSPCS